MSLRGHVLFRRMVGTVFTPHASFNVLFAGVCYLGASLVPEACRKAVGKVSEKVPATSLIPRVLPHSYLKSKGNSGGVT